MNVRGLRVHLTGSASRSCDASLLRAAHQFVRDVSSELVGRGAGLVLGAGDEPRTDGGDSCTFDWTALEVIGAMPDPAPGWPEGKAGRFHVVASQRGLEKIPEWRRELWEKFRARRDVGLETSPEGWRMASAIRERQALRGDVLLVLGGGAGAEHLAQTYMDDARPVVPVRADLDSLSNDGKGGGAHLHARALSNVDPFLRLRDGTGSAAGRLSALNLTAASAAEALAMAAVDLIADLRPPRAFFVRLLASDHDDFQAVERFFRTVVDPVVDLAGFIGHEVGRDAPLAAFMNLEIFRGIHTAGLVIADLTGVRPNCMMELGYALGRQRRFIVTARSGTRLPFDPDKLPTYFWSEESAPAERIQHFKQWLDRYIDLPTLIA
jgi:hypothetical protein